MVATGAGGDDDLVRAMMQRVVVVLIQQHRADVPLYLLQFSLELQIRPDFIFLLLSAKNPRSYLQIFFG